MQEHHSARRQIRRREGLGVRPGHLDLTIHKGRRREGDAGRIVINIRVE